MQTYDIVIVGAGPAGSAAAKIAAEQGMKVVFLERGNSPGEKNASGSAIEMHAAREIIPDFPHEDTPLQRAVEGGSFWLQSEEGLLCLNAFIQAWSTEKNDVKAYTVYRNEFDKWWAEKAVEAGAKLITKTLISDIIKENGKVIGVQTEKGEKFFGNVLIGADGTNSKVAIRSGFRGPWKPNEVALCVKYDYPLPKTTIDRFWGGFSENSCKLDLYFGQSMAPAGYLWIFPNKESISIATGTGLQEMLNGGENLNYYIHQFLQHTILGRILKNVKPRYYISHEIPYLLTYPTKPLEVCRDNVLIVGDAAGSVCNFDGEGWDSAVIGGKKAAEIAIDAISDGDTSKQSFQPYQKWYNSYVLSNLDWGWRIGHWLFNEAGYEQLANPLLKTFATIFDHPHIDHIVPSLNKNLSQLLPLLGTLMLLGKLHLKPYADLLGSLV
ncbi:MAG: NAD(P)/FAD-dependent oxidoreductase [Candidatus Helarchaeota archaeon]